MYEDSNELDDLDFSVGGITIVSPVYVDDSTPELASLDVLVFKFDSVTEACVSEVIDAEVDELVIETGKPEDDDSETPIVGSALEIVELEILSVELESRLIEVLLYDEIIDT